MSRLTKSIFMFLFLSGYSYAGGPFSDWPSGDADAKAKLESQNWLKILQAPEVEKAMAAEIQKARPDLDVDVIASDINEINKHGEFQLSVESEFESLFAERERDRKKLVRSTASEDLPPSLGKDVWKAQYFLATWYYYRLDDRNDSEELRRNDKARKVFLSLASKLSYVVVKSNPNQAEISLDGKKWGETTTRGFALKGPRVFSFRKNKKRKSVRKQIIDNFHVVSEDL